MNCRDVQEDATCPSPAAEPPRVDRAGHARVRQGEARAGRRARVLAARARLRGDPAGHAARAGAGRRGGAHPAVRRQPRHRDAGVPGRRAAGPVRRDAGAVPGGGLPGAGQVRLPQRRRRRAGTAGAARPHGLLPVPAPDRLRGAGRRRDRRARGRAARARRARRHRRDRRQRPVGRRAAARRPGHRRRRRDGRLLRRTPAEPVPGGARSRSSTSMPAGPRSRPRSASTSRCRPTPPTAATWSCTPARRPPGSSGRSTCSRPRARSSTSAGTATPRSSSRSAARSTRAASASAPARSAPSPRPAAGAARRPTGWRSRSTCCATPPSTRSSPGESRFDELPDVMARLAAGSLPALCHTITYDEG